MESEVTNDICPECKDAQMVLLQGDYGDEYYLSCPSCENRISDDHCPNCGHDEIFYDREVHCFYCLWCGFQDYVNNNFEEK